MSETWQYGCGNYGCMFGHPRQHTNGPCYCNRPRGPEERARLRQNVRAAMALSRREGREESADALAQAREEGRREGQNTGVTLAIQAMESVLLGSNSGSLSRLELYQHCKADTARRILEEEQGDE